MNIVKCIQGKQKSIRMLFVIFLGISFGISGCGMSPDGPETVSIGDHTYATGFYGTLFPHKFDFSEEIYEVDDTEYRGIEYDRFDLIHADIGSYTEGTIYCRESQFDEAEKYYSDPENYTYYCRVGEFRKESDPEYFDISEEIDPEMFEALREFAEQNSYEPFDLFKNSGIEKIEVPIPDKKTSPTLVFYKESKDGIFTSSTGESFHIIDGELVLVYYYDYGFGEYEKLVGVIVPDEISDYIIDFLERYVY